MDDNVDETQFLGVRRLAAGDGEEAAACLRSLLEHLEQQWRHYSLNNMLLVGPNFAAMRDYLLVGCIRDPPCP